MLIKNIFLASSSELKEDREQFEVFINRKNKSWVGKDVFLKLVIWEDFLDAMSKTRLQDEYNKAIRESDLFVMLFCTKVGKYTEEEFETAFGQFKATNKPLIFTYFKDAQGSIGAANQQDRSSLCAFQKKLDALRHFYTRYKNIAELQFHFNQQLDRLAETGFIELMPDRRHATVSETVRYEADLSGSGAIAQGTGATAVGAGGVYVGGKNKGNINTGTQTKINTGGGAFIGGGVNLQGGDFVGRDKISVSPGFSPHDLQALFAPLLTAVTNQAPADAQVEAKRQVEELKTEVAKGKEADDGKIGGLVHGLAKMVPGAIGAIVSMFATPILSGIAGPVTTFVLDELKRV